ncbi:hypothetical protein GC197_01335 [bacterium]|nr:hypothetical protein [bacterium]
MAIAIILLIVILGLGVIVGATAVRDSIVQEYGDIGVALDNLDQSWSYQLSIDPDGQGGNPPHVCSAMYMDPAPTLTDPGTPGNGQAPAGLTFVQIPANNLENPVPNPPGTLP